MPGRTIAIGDVHGCSAALAALLAAVEPSADDVVIALGDYIDRGPDSRGVIEQLLALGRHCRLVHLKGNHEEMVLTAMYNREMLRCWLSCGGVEMLASYGFTLDTAPPWRQWHEAIPREHWAFLAGCRNWYETDTHLFLHAGYDPKLPPDQQPGEVLRWQFTDARKAHVHLGQPRQARKHLPASRLERVDPQTAHELAALRAEVEKALTGAAP
jgi:serine/threonine protein phosphatase 1